MVTVRASEEAMAPVLALGDILTVCRRCGVPRREHPVWQDAGHAYVGLTQREAEALVQESSGGELSWPAQ